MTFAETFANIASMENEASMQKTSEKGGKVYELSFIFVPILAEEAVPSKFSEIKSLIEDLGGQFISEESPKLITLAYTMDTVIANKKNKFNTGYFGWIKFEVEESSVEKLAVKIKLNEDIFRNLLIRTVRENTLAPKKNMVKERGSRKSTDRTVSKEESAPMDTEKVDQKIDELIVA